jgi:hypothetical protein
MKMDAVRHEIKISKIKNELKITILFSIKID